MEFVFGAAGDAGNGHPDGKPSTLSSRIKTETDAKPNTVQFGECVLDCGPTPP